MAHRSTKLAAVKQNGFAIRYIPEELQTDEIKLEAIRQNPKVISFIKCPTTEMQKEALQKNTDVVSFINGLDMNVVVDIVKDNPAMILDIKDAPYEVVKAAVEKMDHILINSSINIPT